MIESTAEKSSSKAASPIPLVSIALPVYNGEKYLAVALDSILAQTFTNFELIVIDDGSTDGTLKILRKYESLDSRVKLVTRENRGLPASLNQAISLAKGSLIARMDQDDICKPNRLATQVEFIQQHCEVVVLGSAANFIDEDGSNICTFIPSSEDVVLRKAFPNSPFIHPSVMFVKDAFFEAGKYIEKMKWGGEDVTLFERMSRLGCIHNLTEPLICYRLVPGSLSRKPPVFRSMLTKVVDDQIAGNLVTGERFAALEQEARKTDKSKAVFDYHFEVAKLYVWSGGSRGKAMAHLKKCMSFQYSMTRVFFIYLLTFMPRRWVHAAYFRLKGRLYESI